MSIGLSLALTLALPLKDNELCCPVTMVLFVDPVMAKDATVRVMIRARVMIRVMIRAMIRVMLRVMIRVMIRARVMIRVINRGMLRATCDISGCGSLQMTALMHEFPSRSMSVPLLRRWSMKQVWGC